MVMIAQSEFVCKPQSFVHSNIAEHIERFGVPAATATVKVTASLKAWESIRALKPDGTVTFTEQPSYTNSAINGVRNILQESLIETFREMGRTPELIDITDLITGYHEEEERKKAERAEADRIRNEDRLQNEARVKNEKEAFKKEMAEWITAHGSDRLKFCLGENIDCESAYRDERILKERSGWWWDVGLRGSSKEPRNPSIEAFDVLKEARKVQPDAKLYFHTEDGFYVEDEDGERTGEEVENWRGYVAKATFLGKTIVFGVPDDYWC